MRLTIIKDDQFVSLDGVHIFGVDTSTMPEAVSAVQWYGTEGEIELIDPATGKIIENQKISSIDDFQDVIAKAQEIMLAPPPEQPVVGE